MNRGVLICAAVGCALSGFLCSWAFRLELNQSALPYEFMFEEPANGEKTVMTADKGVDLADAIQFQLRPLFSPSRRPVQIGSPEPSPAMEVADVAPAPVATLARLKLLGTQKASRGSAALIIDEDAGVSDWVAAGESIGGWRILEVHADWVLLAVDDSSEASESELKLTLYPEQDAAP